MVTLEGTVANAKLGAMLMSDDKNHIWIDDFESWPDGYYTHEKTDKKLLVTGTVIKKDDMPVFLVKPGEQATKAGIPVQSEEEMEKRKWRYLLKDVKWTVLE